jgi:hypothetical protein
MPSGLQQSLDEGGPINVYPVPVARGAALHLSGIKMGKTSARILDAQGQQIQSLIFSGKTSISTAGLKPGYYIIEMINGKKVDRKKIIVQ